MPRNNNTKQNAVVVVWLLFFIVALRHEKISNVAGAITKGKKGIAEVTDALIDEDAGIVNKTLVIRLSYLHNKFLPILPMRKI